MAWHDDKHVITGEGIILWDGITRPENNDDGSVSHSIKIAIVENSAEKQEIEQLAYNTLQASEFKGQFPPGGNWPVMAVDVQKLGADAAPLMQGRVAINAKTRNGAPQVFDTNGNSLNAMQYGQMLYLGAIVRLLVHCYAFNNRAKGLALGLDGIQIVDATAPRLAVGGGLSESEVATAFGAGGQQPAPQAMPPGAGAGGQQPAPAPSPGGPPVQPAHDIVNGAPGAVPGGDPSTMAPGTPAPPASAAPTYQMTPKAGGITREQFHAQGWTDDLMIQHGYMVQG